MPHGSFTISSDCRKSFLEEDHGATYSIQAHLKHWEFENNDEINDFANVQKSSNTEVYHNQETAIGTGCSLAPVSSEATDKDCESKFNNDN